MKTLQLLLITLSFVMQTDNIFAQEDSVFRNLGLPSLPNEKKVVRKLSADTILYKFQFEPLLQELYQRRKEVDSLEKEIFVKSVKVDSLEEEISIKKDEIMSLREPEIDDFLNIQDTTIFGSSFVEFSIDQIAPRSKDFYLLIKDIHELNNLLAEMENFKIAQFSTANDKLVEAMGLIDRINSYASIEKRKITEFLSEEQKQFFRDLVSQYNEWNNKLLINAD